MTAGVETHRQHSDTPSESDPARPGRFCGPHCDLYENPEPDGCPDCGRDIDRLGGNPDCPTCAAEPTSVDVFAESLTDSIDRCLEAMADVAEQIHAAERLAVGTPLGDAAKRFAAFHLAELEGKDHGWLGVFAVDALRELREGEW